MASRGPSALAGILAIASAALYSCNSDKEHDVSAAEAAGNGANVDTGDGQAADDSGPNTSGFGPDEVQMLVDPIKTDVGLVAGSIEEDGENSMLVYRGIPYAAPPVGELRWKPPQSVEPWEGIRECTEYSPYATQPWPPLEGKIEPGDTASEDCLYLNVNTPAKHANDRLPVMVWFHGGGLTISSGNMPEYNSLHLPNHDVVTVTVNQRLGPLGYMAHPLLSEEQGGVSGNYGTMDLIAALKWVQKNIAAFGGDPDRVTIFGESGGGTKVTSLLVAPEADGLFHRAIVQSGSRQFSPNAELSLTESEAQGLTLMEACGATSLEEMRALPWETIIDATGEAFGAAGAIFETNLTVDGGILPDYVYNIVQAGQQHDVPLVIGITRWENEMFEQITFAAEQWTKVNSDAYVYVFTHVPSNWSNMYPTHAFEIPYLFSSLDQLALIYNYFPLLKIIGHDPPDDPRWVQPSDPDPGLDESDDYVSEAMASIWTSFAATGNPSVTSLIDCPAYDPANPQYTDIADPVRAKPLIEEVVFGY